MQRTFIVASALLALSVSPAFAGSKFDGFYVGASVGHEATEFDAEYAGIETEASASGPAVGVFAGHGKAYGNYFIGGEFGYDYSTAEFNTTGGSLGFDDSVSVTARVGYVATPDLLLYGLGGYERAHYSFDGDGGFEHDDWVNGLKVGIGAEYVVADNLFLRGEYAHTFTESVKYDDLEVRGDRSVFKAGVGYRF